MKFDFDINNPRPDHTITFATIEGDARQPALLGIEIQPPLHDIAAVGIAKALSADSDEYGGRGPLVGTAHVTRQDEKGTAISVHQSVLDDRTVAERIAKLIDPTCTLKIEVNSNDQKS